MTAAGVPRLAVLSTSVVAFPDRPKQGRCIDAHA
eukprot:CAMPEP_0115344368 /NCGR_PEP_ID=MMETSP0270-20121206/93240_1 /TAXON_ID=71861 /ORGANISM="Scrippsiella trochoidea, Strain CCMP3099" /LENGTH=33 /DNA_ID= /DNA_START= /DNA_END= /DNA_ORIENTATION=